MFEDRRKRTRPTLSPDPVVTLLFQVRSWKMLLLTKRDCRRRLSWRKSIQLFIWLGGETREEIDLCESTPERTWFELPSPLPRVDKFCTRERRYTKRRVQFVYENAPSVPTIICCDPYRTKRHIKTPSTPGLWGEAQTASEKCPALQYFYYSYFYASNSGRNAPKASCCGSSEQTSQSVE